MIYNLSENTAKKVHAVCATQTSVPKTKAVPIKETAHPAYLRFFTAQKVPPFRYVFPASCRSTYCRIPPFW